MRKVVVVDFFWSAFVIGLAAAGVCYLVFNAVRGLL